MTQSEKRKIIAIYYMAYDFVTENGRPPESDQRLAEYVSQIKDGLTNASDNSQDESALSNIEISEAEQIMIDICEELARKYKTSCIFIAEILGFTISWVKVGEPQEAATNAFFDYIEKHSDQRVSRIEALFERQEAF